MKIRGEASRVPRPGPDNAISKTGDSGQPYLIDLDYCKGCGLCVSECPSGAIDMFPEEI